LNQTRIQLNAGNTPGSPDANVLIESGRITLGGATSPGALNLRDLGGDIQISLFAGGTSTFSSFVSFQALGVTSNSGDGRVNLQGGARTVGQFASTSQSIEEPTVVIENESQPATPSASVGGGTACQISNNSPSHYTLRVINERHVQNPSLSGPAAFFEGEVRITSMLFKNGGGFQIDHPLEPENKYLYHSFVESPDMMNVYNGNVVLDERGEAWVQLPEWFEVLNCDFRYQLTPLGAAAPHLHIAEEVKNNRFKIAGGCHELKVSWQITGIRQDTFANNHRIPVEKEKSEAERGCYYQMLAH
jgi:hypothetical protein